MGWSGSDGKGKGSWTPAWKPAFQKQEKGSWGTGCWGKDAWGKGGGKAGGKGMSHRNFRIEQKAWIGGLPEGVTSKELHELMKSAGAKWCEVFTGKGLGQGVACFPTAEEAQSAIATMQGSQLHGAALQVDVWERQPKQG